MTGIERIAIERKKQIEKDKWVPEHDDRHVGHELLLAAIAYARIVAEPSEDAGEYWPWEEEAWRPSESHIRNLEKAGALIAAEIDRLEREDQVDWKSRALLAESRTRSLEDTVKGIREELNEIKHPRVWGYDG